MISNHNGFHTVEQNSKNHENIPFTLGRISEDILEFYK